MYLQCFACLYCSSGREGKKRTKEYVVGGGREEGEGTEYKNGRVSCRVSDKLLRGSIWPIAAWIDYSLKRRINKS
jgi:hypothetical protein